MKFSLIVKKETRCSLCKWWPCNSRHECLEIQSTMEETLQILPDKKVLEKLTRERKSWAFYATTNKLKL
jgi:hypothetical protein